MAAGHHCDYLHVSITSEQPCESVWNCILGLQASTPESALKVTRDTLRKLTRRWIVLKVILANPRLLFAPDLVSVAGIVSIHLFT